MIDPARPDDLHHHACRPAHGPARHAGRARRRADRLELSGRRSANQSAMPCAARQNASPIDYPQYLYYPHAVSLYSNWLARSGALKL
jgi:hypothetical protein